MSQSNTPSLIKYKGKVYRAVDARGTEPSPEILQKEKKAVNKILDLYRGAVRDFNGKLRKVKSFAESEYDSMRKDGYESQEVYRWFQKLSYTDFNKILSI